MKFSIGEKVKLNNKEEIVKSRVREYPSRIVFYILESGQKVSEDQLSKWIKPVKSDLKPTSGKPKKSRNTKKSD